MLQTISGEAYAPVAEFQVSADALEYQTGLAFAKLGDGGFVAVWTDSRFGNGSMRMQRFDLNGAKVGAEIVLPAGGGASLAPTPSGGFLLTYTVEAPYPTSFEVKGRFYDSALNALGPEFAVNTRTDGFQENEGVAALAGGGYVVMWGQPEDSGPDHVRAQILDPAGNKIGGEIIVTDGIPGDKYAMDVVALAGGGFVASWMGWSDVDQNGFPSAGVRAQVFDSAGNKVGAAFSLNTILTGAQASATLEALPSGGFVAAWTDDGNRYSGGGPNGNQGVWVQLFDSLGQKTGAAVRLGDWVTSVPTIAVTATGFLVTWPDMSDLVDGRTELRGQRFDFAGNKVAEEFVVGAASAAHLAPTALVLDSGAILLGWTQRATSGFTYDDVHAQLLIPVLHGTEGADGYAGAAGRDFYLGHGGDDTLSGGADDDGLSGGAGNDVLSGGTGNDILDGGAGADAMTGGAGDDSYSVDDSGDSVTETAGEGSDTVETSLADYAAPAAVENLTGTLGAGATQILRGNALSNVLAGGDADNVFHAGSGGHDVVNGNGGEDTLYIDWSDSTSSVTNQILHTPFADGPSAVYRDGTGRSVTYTRVETVDVTTGSGNDTLATPSSHPIYGPVSTRLSTGAGNDVAYLNSTLDRFDGGGGIDGVYISNVADTAEPFEWRVPSNLFVSPAGTPQLANVEYFLYGVTGGGNDIVETGRLALDDSLYTSAGDDLVTFYNGRDFLDAGPGSDTLVIDWRDSAAPVLFQLYFSFSPDDPLSGSASSGSDRTLTFSGVEQLVLFAGSAADSLTGSDRSDRLSGGGGNDTLLGAVGDDVIEGGEGNDRLDGGAGADTMRGGAGNDIYWIDNAADVVEETPGAGTDEVRTSLATAGLAAYANVENLTGTSAGGQTLTGNSGNNVVTGGSGNDVLRLDGGGTDTANGGAGNDNIFFIGALTAADVVNGGAGVDTLVVQGPYGSLTLTANVTQIENVSILGGNNTAFGEPGTNLYDYVLTTHNSNFAAGVQARINGSALLEGEDFTFNGSAETDASYVVYGGKGKDTLTGGLGNDIFFYAEERFASGDTVNGGAGYDGMFLRGNYTIDFNAPGYTGLFTNIENLTLTSATDERYARGGGTEFDYNLVLSDAIVNAGQELTVSGALLMASETMIVDASLETNGRVRLFGGAAADTLKGGALADLLHGAMGADTLRGGGGADVFRYQAVTESYSVARDHILDFTPGTDKIELTSIDANRNVGGDQAFAWIGSNAFSKTAGELRAFQSGGQWIVQGDINGDGFADLVVALTLQGPTPLGAGDFLL